MRLDFLYSSRAMVAYCQERRLIVSGERKRLNVCGPYLRQIREEKNLSLIDIQAALDIDYGIFIDRTNLGRIESGARTVSDIELLVFAHLLDVSIAQLLGIEKGLVEIGDLLQKVQARHASRRRSPNKDS